MQRVDYEKAIERFDNLIEEGLKAIEAGKERPFEEFAKEMYEQLHIK